MIDNRCRDGFYEVEAEDESVVINKVEYALSFTLLFTDDEFKNLFLKEAYVVGESEYQDVSYEQEKMIENYLEKNWADWK